MRIATFNIRNGRAIDRSSLWWFRRARLVEQMRRVDADVWGLQEAYPSQIDYVRRSGFGAPEWSCAGQGRNANGGGEAVPLLARTSLVTLESDITRWFGSHEAAAGSRVPGASHPRISTIARYCLVGGESVAIANLHLDSDSTERRAQSLEQLATWIEADVGDSPLVVLGDFNGALSEPGFAVLRERGLTSVLPDDAGPTSNGFGRNQEDQGQIDHIFVSAHFQVDAAWVDRAAGHASDHFPVVAELTLSSPSS